jgi:hypothetical protein
VPTELDRLIQETRSQLKDAFAQYRKAREAIENARMHRRGDRPAYTAPEALETTPQIQTLESEEQDAAARFNAISDELARLHRGKFGEWPFPWRGPRPSP